MMSIVSVSRVGAALIPVLVLGALGAKALVAPNAPISNSSSIQPIVINTTSPIASSEAPKVETAGATASSSTVSMGLGSASSADLGAAVSPGLQVILPVRSVTRP